MDEAWVVGLGVAAWAVLCWLGLAFVTVPLTLLAVAAGLIGGATLTVVGYLQIYRGAEDARVMAMPDPETPRGTRAPYPRWDDAWPSYLSWQVERDVGAAVAWPGRMVNRLLAEATRQARTHAGLLLGLLPATPAAFGFLAGVTAGTYGGWLVIAAAVEAVLIIPRCARLCAISALRTVDFSVRWWRGMAVTCAGCRHVAWLPAYRCDEHVRPVLHRDLRPGRLGVWQRRCQCGTPLPTTILRAARVPTLKPACPNCGGLLHPGAGARTDARIVLSGGPAVGKTRLLVRAAVEMTKLDLPSSWQPADEHTATWLDAMQAPMEKHAGGRPDPPARPQLLTFSRSPRGMQQYFHIVDLDGRHFQTAANSPELWQLGTTRRHLLVLDPTVLPSIRNHMGSAGSSSRPSGGQPSDYSWAETTVAEMELPYRILVAQLNRLGARTRQCALAFVVSKADCLAAHGHAPGQDPSGTSATEPREWLRTIELHNLVDAAEHDFAKVRCFLVGEGQGDSAAPFEWLLRQYPRGAATP
jgi:Double-GTPase 2